MRAWRRREEELDSHAGDEEPSVTVVEQRAGVGEEATQRGQRGLVAGEDHVKRAHAHHLIQQLARVLQRGGDVSGQGGA